MKPERLLDSGIHMLRNPNTGKPVRTTFLFARRMAQAEGLALPSIRDHDQLLFGSECVADVSHIIYRRRRDRKAGCKEEERVGTGSYLHLDVTLGLKLLHSYYTAWAREILVLPGMGEPFEGTRDIRDGLRNWVLPKVHLPSAALGKPDTGLLIDEYELERIATRDGETIFVHPRAVQVIEDLPRGFGRHDPRTGLPRMASEVEIGDFFTGYNWHIISDDARRLLMRNPDLVKPTTGTVAPVLKGLWLPGPLPTGPWLEAPFYDGRHAVLVSDYSTVHGVGGVELPSQR